MGFVDSNEFLLFDGAFGTMIQNQGLAETGVSPVLLNITDPEAVTAIHKAYVDAGSQVITANTFEANRYKLEGSGYSVQDVVKAGVEAARRSGAEYVALDIGPTGKLLKPLGDLSFEEVYEAFAEMVRAGSDADLILIETFSDLLEARAALLAARENSDLPVFVTMTYYEDGRTFTGTDAEVATLTLQALGADAVGVNCSLEPEKLEKTVQMITAVADLPVIVQANAGLPVLKDNQTVYDVNPQDYADGVEKFVRMGVSVIGGCCGTTPEYIREIKKRLVGLKPVQRERHSRPAVTSASKLVYLDRIASVGEKINPTGKEKLKESLRQGNFDEVLMLAVAQENSGADVIDLNLGVPGTDEVTLLKNATSEVSIISNLPVQFDSSNPEALAEAIRIYPGIPIINSVNGTEESLNNILPIAQKYGAYLIGLCLDEEGIPKTREKRIEIAEKIIKRAEEMGIGAGRIIIDPLALSVAVEHEQVQMTLDTIEALSRKGIKTTLGISNISFGLPDRENLNAHFLSEAFARGLTTPIVNTESPGIRKAIDVAKLIRGELRPENFSGTEEVRAEELSEITLEQAIFSGMEEEAQKKTSDLLKSLDPQEIIEDYFIPALDEVGERYESGEIFLPQLIQSAAVVKACFGLLREKQSRTGEDHSRGKILLATVKGDIHDIGKNIVRMMLENYDFKIIDLGTDVDTENIIKYINEENISLVGLSALMTTTVEQMERTIEAIKKNNNETRIMVGGAVLTPEYAEKIGADYYGRDAQESVRIASNFFGG